MSARQALGAWFWALMLATVLVQAVVFASRPMTSYRALDLGAGTWGVGVVAASFALLPLALAVPAGRWVDSDRAVTLLRAGAACTFLGAAGLALAGSLPALVLGNVVAGTGLLLTAVAAQGIIARRAPAAEHDRAFGLFTVAASVGQLLGPLLSGTVAHRAAGAGGDDPRAGLFAAAVLAVALIFVAWWYRGSGSTAQRRAERTGDSDPLDRQGRRTTSADDGPATIGGILRTRGMTPAMLSSLALLTAVDLITAFLPVLAEERGISPQTVGWLLALRALASIASRLLVAWLAARWGRRWVLVVSMSVSAVLLATVPLASSVVAVLAVLMVLAGFTLGIGQPLTMSWVTALVPRRSRGTALAVRLSANRIGQVVVPLAAGGVAGMAGTGGVFVLTGSLLCAGSASVLLNRPTAEGGG